MDGGGGGGVETSQTGGGGGANEGVNHIDVAINVAAGHGVRAGSLLCVCVCVFWEGGF